jgi:8-oxo-dGTP pyrophosphatase MutT (NUDIX family)
MRTPSTPILDPSLSPLREILREMESTLPPLPEPEVERAHASVAVILRGAPELELLMIRRAQAEGDPWSGQMALPGGRRDPSDRTLLETALRETVEETSVALEGGSIHLGRLESVTPATPRLPPISIFPFVFAVPDHTQALAASREVDEVMWVPLADLQDQDAQGSVEIRYRDGSAKEFPCLRVQGRVVWGLTYRILNGLFQVLPGETEHAKAEG